MDDILRLINEFNAEQCGGSITIREENGHVEVAVNDQGTWVITPKYRELLASTARPAPKLTAAQVRAAAAAADAQSNT